LQRDSTTSALNCKPLKAVKPHSPLAVSLTTIMSINTGVCEQRARAFDLHSLLGFQVEPLVFTPLEVDFFPANLWAKN
jgi:hypothetical protein